MLIGLAISLAIVIGFVGFIQDSSDSAVENSTGAASTLYSFVPLLFAAIIALSLMGYVSFKRGRNG